MTESFFYCKPLETALSAGQVKGQMGFDPEVADLEVLISRGLYPVRDGEKTGDPLENPEVIYKDMGTYYERCPSPKNIDLEEARIKAKLFLIQKTEERLKNLAMGNNLRELVPFMILSGLKEIKSETLISYMSQQTELLKSLDNRLHRIEKATCVASIREILNS